MYKEQKQLKGRKLLEKVNNTTYFQKKATLNQIEQARKADLDTERSSRLKSNLCSYCYYLKGTLLAGAAITNTSCVVCSKEMIFGSTHTDKVCPECAKKHKICKRCLSDTDFKIRRKI